MVEAISGDSHSWRHRALDKHAFTMAKFVPIKKSLSNQRHKESSRKNWRKMRLAARKNVGQERQCLASSSVNI
jgi:hypothetical protein